MDKVVDYDEKIKQKASVMADSELNRFFYRWFMDVLDWDAKQYVPGFEIYQQKRPGFGFPITFSVEAICFPTVCRGTHALPAGERFLYPCHAAVHAQLNRCEKSGR